MKNKDLFCWIVYLNWIWIKKDELVIYDNIEFIKSEEDIIALGIPAPFSSYIMTILQEVFDIDYEHEKTQIDEFEMDDDIFDILSIDEPYNLSDESGSSDHFFWQDLFD